MNVETQKVIDRIRKMLALANDAGASEGERDNAMRMAHNTMVKFNIDAAMVEQANPTASKEPRVEKGFSFYGRPWARNVAHNVGRLFFCSYLSRSEYKTKNAVHLFIGRESNVVTAGEIARYVVESIMKEGKRRQRENFGDNDWFRSFCWGASNSILRRVNEMIAESTKPTVEKLSGPAPETTITRSMALVLVNRYKSEHDENQSLIKTLHPKMGKARTGKGIGSFEGRQQGTEFGKTVSLNRQIGGKS